VIFEETNNMMYITSKGKFLCSAVSSHHISRRFTLYFHYRPVPSNNYPLVVTIDPNWEMSVI